ncbi:hypothetical protein U9M48_007657 [Paspalum notatum var. saurae]|uniref:Uncharacterized protein n=1 Tax=Paspalum notatum var. saurae TaxID=547442 RepID=A0AAQ3WBV8_PASNO
MGRKACGPKEGLNRGSWTAMEDDILVSYIRKHGEGKWGCLPRKAGLKRCGKSCRLRWLNYLRPGIKRGNISSDEEELIIRLHRLLGNRWSLIAGRLPGRTDNEIKNYWNTTLGRKAVRTTTSGGQPKGGTDEAGGASPICRRRLPLSQTTTGAVSGAAPDAASPDDRWSRWAPATSSTRKRRWRWRRRRGRTIRRRRMGCRSASTWTWASWAP